MNFRGAISIAAAVVLSMLAHSAVAQAAPPKLWGGTGFNDLGASSGLLSARNGQVRIKNVQLIMACTDVGDGTESERAFWAQFNHDTPLRRNKFDRGFSYRAGGRLGWVRVRGHLRSNRTGAIRVDVTAVANGSQGQVVERCQATTRITLRRGP